MDYTELRQSIIDYADNDEDTFEEYVDQFIVQAEQEILFTMEFSSLRKDDTSLSLTSGNRFLDLPDDFIALYSLGIIDANGKVTWLKSKEDGYMRAVYPNPATLGVPRYWEEIGDQRIEVGPTPNANYGIMMAYFHIPESIVTAGTTWLGDNCAEALLAQSLQRAGIFLKWDEDILKAIDQRVKAAMQTLQTIGRGRIKRDYTRRG